MPINQNSYGGESIMIKPNQIIKKNHLILLMVAVLATLILACSNQRYIQPSCTLPSGVSLEEALAHSREDLARLECEQMFDGYYDRLLDVAKRDPDIENRRRFSEFLVWAKQNRDTAFGAGSEALQQGQA